MGSACGKSLNTSESITNKLNNGIDDGLNSANGGVTNTLKTAAAGQENLTGKLNGLQGQALQGQNQLNQYQNDFNTKKAELTKPGEGPSMKDKFQEELEAKKRLGTNMIDMQKDQLNGMKSTVQAEGVAKQNLANNMYTNQQQAVNGMMK